MKKSISILMLGLMTTTGSIGQYNTGSSSSESYVDPVTKENSFAMAAGLSKAKKNFQKLNKHVEGLEWYDITDGFAAYYFTKDRIKGKSYFDSKGGFLWSILSYGEKDLPAEIRIQVKSVYFLDYRITQVLEIRHNAQPGAVIYLVQVTNDKVWKKLRIQGGEMEVVEEFSAL